MVSFSDMKILLTFNGEALETLKSVVEAGKYQTPQALFYELLRREAVGFHAKQTAGTPGRPKKIKPWDGMDPADYCRQVGGTVSADGKFCIIGDPEAGFSEEVSLANPELFVDPKKA